MPDSVNVQTHPWYSRDHHREGGGFKNIWPPYPDTSVVKGATWFFRHLFYRKENRLPEVHPVEKSTFEQGPSGLELTWIGHSTMLVRTPERTLLLDPMFGDRASPLSFAGPKREVPLPLGLADLPPIDVVLLSHGHYDHLDGASVTAIAAQHDPIFFVPLGLSSYVQARGGRRVVEMDWWQFAEIDGRRYHCVPAKHFSGRSLFDRDETLWAGWYVEGMSLSLYYAGDTGYAKLFTHIRERLGVPQIAVLPIGAFLPPWLMQPVHVNPAEALQAFDDLGSEHMIPVHWGTFDLAEEPLHAPADALRRLVAERSLQNRVHLLAIGETVTLG